MFAGASVCVEVAVPNWVVVDRVCHSACPECGAIASQWVPLREASYWRCSRGHRFAEPVYVPLRLVEGPRFDGPVSLEDLFGSHASESAVPK